MRYVRFACTHDAGPGQTAPAFSERATPPGLPV